MQLDKNGGGGKQGEIKKRWETIDHEQTLVVIPSEGSD